VEVAFNDVQVSPHYPGRVALRFARVRRYRPDKSAAQADSIEAVVALVPQALSRGAPGE
jgi:DNA ligase-1